MPKRILLLSASAGAGHIRAADALLKQFQLHPAIGGGGGGQVEHWDILKYTNAVFRTIYSNLYLDLINRAPTLLGMVYNSTDKPWKETMAQAFEKLNAAPFIKALRDYNPDLIVATHFTGPNIISWLKSKRPSLSNPHIPSPAIVVTDLDVHAMWLTRSYARYFVSLEESKIYLQKMGIPSEKIIVSGIPTDPVFSIPKDKATARRELQLDPTRFTILVSAGGFGVGPIESLIEQLQQLRSPVQIVAIAGKSKELLAKLERLQKKINVQHSTLATLVPVGFTTRMDAYMAAADILISKPGGLTTAEAMNRTLPMCIVNPIPGQEERNSDHLLEAGVAIKCNNPPTLAWKLEQLINNPHRMEVMRHNIRTFAKPHAAQIIVQTLMS
ncbi:MAG TPA: glycosyltransferase [Phycisphaerae bacterium]|nr:glycosyltransferase [Phycisphaerae bacterium]